MARARTKAKNTALTELARLLTEARAPLQHANAQDIAAAEAAGYASRSHFVRRFRSVFGSTPSEHRARRL